MWQSGCVDTGAGEIAYWALDLEEPWRKGRATPVVFQHGLGLSSQVWRPWLKRIATYHPVVTIDLRGHGNSSAAWVKQDYSLNEFANDVTAILDHLDIAACHFIGESFGGTMGLHLAAQRPDRIASLVVCSTGIYGEWISNIGGWPDLLAREGISAWSKEILEGRFPPDSVNPELVEWVDKSQCAIAERVVAGLVRGLQGADLREELRGLPTPLLVISPVGSPFVDLRAARALRDLVPLSETVFLRDARHGVVMSHWRECSRLASAFIGRVEAQRRPKS